MGMNAAEWLMGWRLILFWRDTDHQWSSVYVIMQVTPGIRFVNLNQCDPPREKGEVAKLIFLVDLIAVSSRFRQLEEYLKNLLFSVNIIFLWDSKCFKFSYVIMQIQF